MFVYRRAVRVRKAGEREINFRLRGFVVFRRLPSGRMPYGIQNCDGGSVGRWSLTHRWSLVAGRWWLFL